MTTHTPFTEYRDHARRLIGSLPGFDTLREEAIARLDGMTMPSQKSEAFRYAPLKALKAGAIPQAERPADMTDADLPAPLSGDAAARLVYVDGHYMEEVSRTDALPDTVMVRALSNYFRSAERDDGTRSSRSDLPIGADALALLNTALTTGGIAVQVPAGCRVEAPLEILHFAGSRDGRSAHPRHVIELGEGASLTLIEHYTGGAAASWLNESLSVRVSEGAELTHVRIVEEGENATHTSRLSGIVDAGGRYRGLSVLAGGAESRFESDIRLLGDDAFAETDAVLLAGTGESAEMIGHIHHTVPHTNSTQVIRAIGRGRGRTTYQGKVTVAVDAQKSEADQSIKSLLLDRTAEANAKPELEIHADDVKCSHGATVGELDKSAYFYLVSRGISPDAAQRLLVDAFAAAALGLVENSPVRAAVERRIADFIARAHTDRDAENS